MSVTTANATVPAGKTTVSATISHQQAALAWTVGQISVGVAPFRPLASAIISLNGGNLTSTVAGSADAATGPPPITLYAGDVLTITWSAVQAGDVCTATAIYTETSRAALPDAYGGQAPTLLIPGIG